MCVTAFWSMAGERQNIDLGSEAAVIVNSDGLAKSYNFIAQ